MFHGGTNFGFLNGANLANTFPSYMPIVTSYGEFMHLNIQNTFQIKYYLIHSRLRRTFN